MVKMSNNNNNKMGTLFRRGFNHLNKEPDLQDWERTIMWVSNGTSLSERIKV